MFEETEIEEKMDGDNEVIEGHSFNFPCPRLCQDVLFELKAKRETKNPTTEQSERLDETLDFTFDFQAITNMDVLGTVGRGARTPSDLSFIRIFPLRFSGLNCFHV